MATSSPLYVTTGALTLPNSQLKIAYKLWSNQPNQTPSESFPPNLTPDQLRTRLDGRLNFLALHGLHDNAASFDLIIPKLFQTFSLDSSLPPLIHFLCVDLVGHGLSDWRPIDSTYNLPNYVADLHALLLQVLHWREYIIVGHSMGANIAAILAATHTVIAPMTSLFGNNRSGHNPATTAAVPTTNTQQLSPASSASASLATPSSSTASTATVAKSVKPVKSPRPPPPMPPVVLGCIFLDPMRYSNWKLIPGTEEQYRDFLTTSQSPPNAVIRAVEDRFFRTRTPRKLYATLDEIIGAYQKGATGIENESVRTLLTQRGVRFVKRRRIPKKARLSLDDPPVQSNETMLDPAHPPVPGRDYDPSVDEVGWVFTYDPLLSATVPIDMSRNQIHTAVSTLRSPALLIHCRDTAITSDRNFLQHVDDIWHKETIFDLFVGQGLGEMKEVAGDHHIHMDEPDDILPLLTDSIHHYWNNRTNTRAESLQQQELMRRQLMEREQRIAAMEEAMFKLIRESGQTKEGRSADMIKSNL